MTDINTAYAVGGYSHSDAIILKTDDGGYNWFPLNSGTNNPLFDIYFTDNNTGYIVGRYDPILKTMDAGITWILKPYNYPTWPYWLLSVHFPTQNVGYAMAFNSAVLKTTDSGETWEVLRDDSNFNSYAVFFTDNSTGYIAGKDGWILKTIDGGYGWSYQRAGYSDLNSIYFTSSTTGYAISSSAGIYKTVDAGGPTSIEEKEIENYPLTFSLSQNHPNPFNSSTKIKFDLPKQESVKIEIFNLLGQKIEILVNQYMSVGSHEIEFVANNLPSGVYLYRIDAGGFHQVKKMILLQ